VPFVNAFKAEFGNFPSYCGYTAYDQVYYIADAIKRAGSTDSDKLADAMSTDLRPSRSPKWLRMIAPTGRAKKPTPTVPIDKSVPIKGSWGAC
jgi:hypothetical protein